MKKNEFMKISGGKLKIDLATRKPEMPVGNTDKGVSPLVQYYINI